MLFHHLIWDFDGTLFDTYPAVVRAMLLGLADFGITEQEDRIARSPGAGRPLRCCWLGVSYSQPEDVLCRLS